jgi:hypothetical protein
MTLSQKIANDPKCRHDARAFDASNSDELFQNAWLKVYNYEQKNKEKAELINNHRAFFFRTLRSEFIDSVRKNKRRFLDIDKINETRIIDLDEELKTYKDYLTDWLEETPSDEMNLFYKNIINLVLICGSVKSAVEMCPMGKTKFNHYLQEAKQKFKDDFNRNANSDNLHCIDVV